MRYFFLSLLVNQPATLVIADCDKRLYATQSHHAFTPLLSVEKKFNVFFPDNLLIYFVTHTCKKERRARPRSLLSAFLQSYCQLSSQLVASHHRRYQSRIACFTVHTTTTYVCTVVPTVHSTVYIASPSHPERRGATVKGVILPKTLFATCSTVPCHTEHNGTPGLSFYMYRTRYKN